MRKLSIITFIVLGVNGARAEELQDEHVQGSQSSQEVAERVADEQEKGEEGGGVHTCKNDSVLDSLDKALGEGGSSLESKKIFELGKKLQGKHGGQLIPNKGKSVEGDLSRESVMVEVPLTPEIIYDFMDTAIKKAKACQSSWYKDISSGKLNITDETKAGAAAFIAEALKNKVPRQRVEFMLLAYFKGNLKWDELMALAQNKNHFYSKSKNSFDFPYSKQKITPKLPLGEAR